MEMYGCTVTLTPEMTMSLLMKECYLDFVSKSLQGSSTTPKDFSLRLLEEQKEHSVKIKALIESGAKGPLGPDPINIKEKIEDTASFKALNGSHKDNGSTDYFDKMMNKFDKPKDENDV